MCFEMVFHSPLSSQLGVQLCLLLLAAHICFSVSGEGSLWSAARGCKSLSVTVLSAWALTHLLAWRDFSLGPALEACTSPTSTLHKLLSTCWSLPSIKGSNWVTERKISVVAPYLDRKLGVSHKSASVSQRKNACSRKHLLAVAYLCPSEPQWEAD